MYRRDVQRLQRLAPNVNVINMYGTTETQRAVSYLVNCLDYKLFSIFPCYISPYLTYSAEITGKHDAGHI